LKTADHKTSFTHSGVSNPFFSKDQGVGFFEPNQIPTQFFFNSKSSSGIQAKLEIGEPNDKFEVEADAVADRVIQKLATPDIANRGREVQTKPLAASVVQTKCDECEKEEKLEKKEKNLQESGLKRKVGFEIATKTEPRIDSTPGKNDEKEKKIRKKEEEKGQELNGEELNFSPVVNSELAKVESHSAADKRNSANHITSSDSLIQTKCENFEKEDGFQRKEMEEEHVGQEKLHEKIAFENKTSSADDLAPERSNNAPIDNNTKSSTEIGTPVISPLVSAPVTQPAVQAKCAECQQEEAEKKDKDDDTEQKRGKLQKKPVFENNEKSNDEDKDLQRKPSSNTMHSASSAVESSLASSKGSGISLSPAVRTQMESSFGADFSSVRIHNDSTSTQLSKDLHAQAFTHGSDIYFNSGKYDTSTNDGRHLLAHELTHTLQQGATVYKKSVPDIQRQDAAIKSSVDIIIDRLDGYTSGWDSEDIANEFRTHDTTALVTELKSRAPAWNMTEQEMISWLMGDINEEDRWLLVDLFIKARLPEAEDLVSNEIINRLGGYTSEDDSQKISSLILKFSGAELDNLLAKTEQKANESAQNMADWLFGDTTSVQSEKIRVHFFAYGGLRASRDYAAYYTADKVESLLSGYTSHADSTAILQNFKRLPSQAQLSGSSLTIYALDKRTRDRWGQSAEDALMEDMDKEDYEELRTISGNILRPYDYERGWLEVFLSGAHYVVSIVEFGVCGLAGVVTGILSVVWDIIVLVKDVAVAVWDILGTVVYFMTGGAAGSSEWLAFKNFFKSLGHMLGHPIDTIKTAWNELEEEASLIEGPFSNCRKAEFWVRKFVNLLVNIVLILAAGYGLIKGGATALKTIVGILRANGFRKGLVKIAALALKSGGAAVAGLTGDVVKVIEALASPVETIGKIRGELNMIKAAAAEKGYWQFMKGKVGEKVIAEQDFWEKYRQSWAEDAAKHEAKAGKIDSDIQGLSDDIEADKLPPDADTKTKKVETDTNQLKNDVDDLNKKVKGEAENKPETKPEEKPETKPDEAKDDPSKKPVTPQVPQQVPYGSTDLSKQVINERLKLGPKTKGPPQRINGQSKANFAVFEYTEGEGTATKIKRSKIFEGHSERLIHDELQKLGIKPEQVTRIYTERAPCTTRGCAALIREYYPHAEVTYSFEFGADAESMKAGNAAHAKAVDGLFEK